MKTACISSNTFSNNSIPVSKECEDTNSDEGSPAKLNNNLTFAQLKENISLNLNNSFEIDLVSSTMSYIQ